MMPAPKFPQYKTLIFETWPIERCIGSTLIACEKTARDCRLMELDPKYCDVITQRWQNFTGQTATLEATGQPFRASS